MSGSNRETDPIVRVAAQNVTREEAPSALWIVVVCTLVLVSGVLWIAHARDELREIHRLAEKCAHGT